jgi:outer membrane scaffolding protein for murein synthesis (MipA/OmpV family)
LVLEFLVRFALLALAALIFPFGAVPAVAQDTASPPPPSDSPDASGDRVTIGLGIGTLPSYEGSDSNSVVPVGAAIGSISGYAFSTRGTKLLIDAVRNKPGQGIDFQLGPVIGVNLNRTSGIDDPQVEALGRKKWALELGGYAGIGKTGIITSDYDKLSVSVSYVHDVTGVYDSYVITPEIDYGTPLSRKAFVALSANASYAGRGYARSYFTVDPVGSLRSGLPVYYADKGWKNWSVTMLGTYSLTGDLLHGLSVAGGVSYSGLLGDFAASPVTSIAGSRSQWIAAVGLAYTF